MRRRAEMKAMVLHYQFGHAPALSALSALSAPDAIIAEVLSETEAFAGKSTKRAVRFRLAAR